MADSEGSSSRPAARFQFGAVSSAVFLHERIRGDGSTFVATTTVLQRTYVDEQGKFQNTSSFGQNDLPKAILALQHAYEFSVARKDAREAGDE